MGEQIDYQLGSSDETVYAFREERCLGHNISECARAALAAPPRVCDVNTLESLTDFVEKTILTSDLLKDAHRIVKNIVVASVRTALAIAYEPANLKDADSEIRDECNRQEQGENNGSK